MRLHSPPNRLDPGRPVVPGSSRPAQAIGSRLAGWLGGRRSPTEDLDAVITSGTITSGAIVADTIPAAPVGELPDRVHALLKIARRLAETFDRDELFRLIVDETNRALRADGTAIALLRGDRLELVSLTGIDDASAAALHALRSDEGWFADLLRTEQPVACDDLRAAGIPGYERYAGVVDAAAILVAPLTHRGQITGTLSSISHRPRRWVAGDIELVTALAAQASIAIGNAELFARTRSHAEQLTVLQAAATRMSRAGSVASVGRAVVEEARRILDYHTARVHVLEPPDQVVPIAFEGRVGESDQVDLEMLRTRLGRGFTGWVAEHGRPLLVGDAIRDPRGEAISGTYDAHESLLVVPMRYDETVVGVITLSKLGFHQFDEDDLRLLTILADHAATALESARLVARSDELAGELRRLLDMSSALSASLDPRQVADLIAAHLAGAMGVDECAISYWDRPGARVLSLGYFPPLRLEDIQPSFDVAGYPETLRVLRDQVTIVIDAEDPAADPAEVALLRGQGLRALAMLPLVAKGQSIGLVELMSKTAFAFDEQRLGIARAMSNEAAIALENARMYEEARSLADRDPLTGFYNHRYLHERLGAEVVRAQRSNRPLSVLMLDLDDFKLVNDTFGHLFGDRALGWIAARIRDTLRSSDVAARYGGDEFAIILPETDAAAARAAARRILAALGSQPFEDVAHGPVPISASIGVATYPADGRTATDLIAAADAGLYRVKRSGGHDVDAGVSAASSEMVAPAGGVGERVVQGERVANGRGTGAPAA